PHPRARGEIARFRRHAEAVCPALKHRADDLARMRGVLVAARWVAAVLNQGARSKRFSGVVLKRQIEVLARPEVLVVREIVPREHDLNGRLILRHREANRITRLTGSGHRSVKGRQSEVAGGVDPGNAGGEGAVHLFVNETFTVEIAAVLPNLRVKNIV